MDAPIQAGPELDALIDERIFRRKPRLGVAPPLYSARSKLSQRVAKELDIKVRHYQGGLENEPCTARCAVKTKQLECTATTAELAICLVALEAIDEGKRPRSWRRGQPG